VRGEDVDAQLVRRPQHVLAAAPQGRGRPLQRVAAVQQERSSRPLGARALDQRGQVRVSAHPPVPGGEGREIDVGERVRQRRAGRHAVVRQPARAGQVRRPPALVAHREQRVGLPEVDRQQRGVRVGQVQQGHVAERLEVE